MKSVGLLLLLRLRLLLLLLLLLAVTCAADDLVSPIVNREIQVSVQAPWPSSPLNVFCEAHAILRSESFLKSLADASPVQVDSYQEATQLAVQLSQQAGIHNPLLKLALTLRSSSPTCELHRGLSQELLQQKQTMTYEDDTDAFAWVNDKVYTDLTTMPDSLPFYDATSYLLPNEEPPHGERTVVILYANLGTKAFQEWYERLTAHYSVVVRHLGTKPTTSFTALQGFGVRLDIRNVEYKVFNEQTATDQEQAAAMVNVSALSTLTPHFLAGVNVTALQSHGHGDGHDPSTMDAQALQAALWKIHQEQQQHAQLIPPAWQRRQLGLQASTVIANSNSNDPLALLQEVSQNLPSVASTLVHVQVPETISQVAESLDGILHSLIQQSGGGLFINGKPLVVERGSFNVFEMIQRLSQEQEALQRLQNAVQPHLPNPKPALEELQTAWMMGEEFFETDEEQAEQEDASTVHKYFRVNVEDGEAGAVLYMNDIEKDSIYKQWPTRLDQALMAMQYGMPPSVRRNLFTMLIVENPLDTQNNYNNIGRLMTMQLMQGQYPVRLALLIVDESDLKECEHWVHENQPKDGEPCPSKGDSWLDRKKTPSLSELKTIRATARDIHRLYTYIDAQFGGQREILHTYEQYMSSTLHKSQPANGEYLTLFEIVTIHSEISKTMQLTNNKVPPVDVAKALLSIDVDDMRFHYFQGLRFAVDKAIKSGMTFLNGRPLPQVDVEDASEAVGTMFMEEQQAIFGMIMKREITDTSPRNLYRKLLSKKAKNVFPKLHPLFTASTEDAYLDWNPDTGSTSLLIPQSMTGTKPSDQEAVIVIDAVLALDTDNGKLLAIRFLKAIEGISATVNDTPVAVAYRVVPSTESAASSPLCSLFASASKVGNAKLLEALEKGKSAMVSEDDCAKLQYLKRGLPSENFLVANGRFYDLEDSKTIDTQDLELLISIHLDHTKAVTQLLKKYVDPQNPYEAVSRATAFLSASKTETTGRLNPYEKILKIEEQLGVVENPLRFTWNGDCNADDLKMSVLAVVDPITESAQRLSPLLQILRDELQLPLTVILAPSTEIDSNTNIPISSYYRFVADSNAYQGADEQHVPMAHFSNLPLDHVLTVRMDVPEPWDIQQTQAVQDTDNLRCSMQSGCSDEAASGTIPEGLEMWNQRHLTKVEYGLEHLLFAGRCFETTAGPPNGLQLTLSKHKYGSGNIVNGSTAEMEVGPDGTVQSSGERSLVAPDSRQTHYSDTLVMKTVGYWQLRANPGVWDLNILQGSRGAEIFDMMEGVMKNGAVVVKGRNQNNNTKQLIMGDFVSQSSLLLVQRKRGYEKASLFSEVQDVASDEDIVHVFSLATGHLYERLLKIMMLSVTKRTSSKVKFWLFENYLSPTFKSSARAMAQRIGCEVEFGTYLWIITLRLFQR